MQKTKESGITLVALVITVIVLLILSSIATYSGLNVVRSSKFTVFTTEMKIMQTKVNEIYQKYKDGNSIEIDGTTYYGENKKSENSNSTILNIGQALDSVSTQANKVFTESASQITNKDGYYIGRYEVGSDNGIPVVKQDKNVINDWDWTLAYENSKEICKRKSVNSYLCSSYSWDTAVNFIQNNGDIDYATNASKYNCNIIINVVKNRLGNIVKNSGEIKLLNTGITASQSNIYDMAGNVMEQTTELNPTDVNGEFKISRGSSFRGDSSEYASGGRADHALTGKPYKYSDFVGYRSTIFIK